jgi:NAD(P)-dependent dehydrogenase (short-subunit alcohol dehydrogenase family)
MQQDSKTKPVALVTGAGKRTGIGFEVCRQMGEAGYRVYLSARDGQAARDLATELSSQGADVRAVELDVTHADSIARVSALIGEEAGSLNALVSNAAAPAVYGETVETADLNAARAIFDATFFGAWAVTQSMLPLLRNSRAGRIVYVSSGAGSHDDPAFGLTSGNAMGPSYATAKAALNALTSGLAHELRNEPILVNAVCPGLTATFPRAEQMGARPVSEGSAGIVWVATLPEGSPNGGFFRDGKQLPW